MFDYCSSCHFQFQDLSDFRKSQEILNDVTIFKKFSPAVTLLVEVPVRCGSQLTLNREGTLKLLSFFDGLRSIKNRRNTTSIPWTTSRTTEKFFPFFYIVFSLKFKVSANVVNLHKTSAVSSNIQDHTYEAIMIMETIPNSVSPYPSTSSSGRSTFESTTINLAFTSRGHPSSSSTQRNCTTSCKSSRSST